MNKSRHAVDEGVLAPEVVEYLDANPFVRMPDDLPPELRDLARSPVGAPPTRDLAEVRDDVVEGVPVRIYRDVAVPSGVIVYFHGGAWCIGSVGLMDNVARELTHASGALVVSVEYRLAPEHPYPAGLDDCETVTRWAVANAAALGAPTGRVVVAGESAGGNLAAAVSLRLRGVRGVPLAGQVLLYPVLASDTPALDSRREFDGIVLTRAGMGNAWDMYCGGQDLAQDPFAAPLHASTLVGLPPALVVLGGCDLLRDEGRRYAERLRDEGVPVEDVCLAGQPHGFLNFDLPAAAEAWAHVGTWLAKRFGR
jgi:acetyl esterase